MLTAIICSYKAWTILIASVYLLIQMVMQNSTDCHALYKANQMLLMETPDPSLYFHWMVGSSWLYVTRYFINYWSDSPAGHMSMEHGHWQFPVSMYPHMWAVSRVRESEREKMPLQLKAPEVSLLPWLS